MNGTQRAVGNDPNRPGDVVRVVGACRKCRTRYTVAGPVSYRVTPSAPNGARFYGDVQCAHGGSDYVVHARCECGGVAVLELVRRKHGGSFSAPCNATCTDAKGALCDCSCQGRNHGTGNRVVRS